MPVLVVPLVIWIMNSIKVSKTTFAVVSRSRLRALLNFVGYLKLRHSTRVIARGVRVIWRHWGYFEFPF
jgi:hypothetical protein